MKQEPTIQAANLGMFTDTDPLNQPKNTYRFALNAVAETFEGDVGSISTEAGNTSCVTLNRNEEIIGARYIGENKQILIVTDDTTTRILLEKNCEVTELVNSACFGFKKHWPVSILSRTIRGCDTVIYFTDKNNPYMSINIDRLEDYNDTDGNFDCTLAQHIPAVSYPNIDVISVNDGGGRLQVGMYQFAVQYLDSSYNEIEWSYITHPVTIYDDNTSSGLGDIDGAWNGETGIRANGVPATNKSITLQITNLDEKYEYVRIAALESTEGLGTVTNTYYTPEIPISNSTITYVYTGDTSNLTFGSETEVQLPRPYIDTVGYHAQIDNRLILGNTSSPNYDFCSFQRYANDITSSFTTRNVDARDPNEVGNHKNPLTSFKLRGFAADEVYAFGIVYVFKSGYESPAFHIPGREHTAYDMILDTVGGNVDLADVVHAYPGIEEGDTIRRWRWRNTGQYDGTMAYWRADNATYPEDVDCNGEYVYGDLAGQSIRHHRFPDRRVIPLYEKSSNTEGTIRVLGIEFDNIEYPHEDIVGHYIVYVKRDEFNRTVLDRGIMTTMNTNTQQLLVSPGLTGTRGMLLWNSGIDDSMTAVKFTSPKTLVRKEYLNGSYFHFEGEYQLNAIDPTDFGNNQFGGNILGPDVRIYYNVFRFGAGGFQLPETYNRSYNANLYMPPSTEVSQVNNFQFNGDIRNLSYFNWANVYNLLDKPDVNDYGSVSSDLFYRRFKPMLVANKVVRDVNTDLYNLEYIRVHNDILTGTATPELFGGDVYISAISYMDCHYSSGDNEENEEDSHVTYDSGLWVESEINMGMRHATTEECGEYYTGGAVTDYALYRLADRNADGDGFEYRDTPCEENYFYNEDYSKINYESLYPSIARRYECCSRCLNSNTNRIWYSIDTDPANQDDGYRVILANNYKNVYGEDQDITDLFVHNDNLYARTNRALYLFPTKEQTLQSNETSIYLGTGEFLSLDPRKILTTDNGYAGGRDDFARITSELGTFFVDRNQNKVFKLQGLNQLKEISGLGTANMFQEKMKLNFLDDWATISDDDYPYQNTTGRYGIGFNAVYDPRHKRYILHKRDYKYIGKGKLRWTGAFFTVDVNQTSVIVEFSNKDYFEDKSFTISFKPAMDRWISFHSYLPKFMYSGANEFYTTNNGSWKHGDKEFLKFYDTDYPHVIDIIINENPSQTWVTDSINYISTAKKWTGDQYNVLTDVTFDGLIGYNDTQTTGYQPLTVQNKNDIYESINDGLLVGRTDSTWKVNGLLNYRTNYNNPIFTTNWGTIKNDYYIDKAVHGGAVSATKDVYQLDRMRDKYFGLRLYYNPTDSSVKLVTDIIGTLKRYSVR